MVLLLLILLRIFDLCCYNSVGKLFGARRGALRC